MVIFADFGYSDGANITRGTGDGQCRATTRLKGRAGIEASHLPTFAPLEMILYLLPPGAISSVGQSTCLTSRGSLVRARHRPPAFAVLSWRSSLPLWASQVPRIQGNSRSSMRARHRPPVPCRALLLALLPPSGVSGAANSGEFAIFDASEPASPTINQHRNASSYVRAVSKHIMSSTTAALLLARWTT